MNKHLAKDNHGPLTDSSLHTAFVISSCSCTGFSLRFLSSCCYRHNQHLLQHLQEITALDITPFTNHGSTVTTMMWSSSSPTGFNLHQVTGFALVPMGTVPGPESQAINRWEEVWREFITRDMRNACTKTASSAISHLLFFFVLTTTGLSKSPVDFNLGTLHNPVYYSIKRQVYSEARTQRSFAISESRRCFCWLFALPPAHSSLSQRTDQPSDHTSSENQSQADDGVGGWTRIVAGLWLTLRQGSSQEAVQSQEGHCPGASFLPLQKYQLTDLFLKKKCFGQILTLALGLCLILSYRKIEGKCCK